MADILVRNVDEHMVQALKERARASGTSMNDVARELLGSAARPSRAALVERARQIHAMGGPFTDDSTALVREDRDTDEPDQLPVVIFGKARYDLKVQAGRDRTLENVGRQPFIHLADGGSVPNSGLVKRFHLFHCISLRSARLRLLSSRRMTDAGPTGTIWQVSADPAPRLASIILLRKEPWHPSSGQSGGEGEA